MAYIIDREFDAETKASLGKIAKLLQLAAKNPNQHEAAAATAKAQALLASLNLDMAAVETATGAETKRADHLIKGGRHIWQRDLWESVAELNFCFYWSQEKFIPDEAGRYRQFINGQSVRGRYQRQHRLVGRIINIQTTKMMAEYLEQTIDRLTRKRCAEGVISLRSEWAFTYRRGLCDEVILAIYEKRKEQLSEETRRNREAAEADIRSTKGSVSTATELTLTSFVKSEMDANADFVYGAGTSAKWAAQRAAQAKAEAEAEAEYVRWATKYPEKAKALEEKRRRQEEARRQRESRRRLGKGGIGAYWMGRDAGKNISLDPQAEGPEAKGLLAYEAESQ